MCKTLPVTKHVGYRRFCSPRAQAARSMSSKNSSVYNKAKELIQRAGKTKPGLVVLDLDYTIWPFWCEMYSPKQTHIAQLFPDSRDIIEACKASDIPMAVASRSPTPATAQAFLKALGLWKGYFDPILITPYVGKDQSHFPKLKSTLGTPYEDMLFFDDEHGNIRQVSKLGVTSILVSTGDGLSLRAFEQGLKLYAKSKES